MVEYLSPDKWRLSAKGRQRCTQLAEEIKPYQPDIIISSSERKARETAVILSNDLGKSHLVAEGLHEHKRSNVSILTSREFQEKIAGMFAHPDRLIFGDETANQAN